MRRIARFVFWVAIGLSTILLMAFIIWGLSPLKPMAEALEASLSDPLVSVEFDNWMIFKPVTGNYDTGLILYPGGHVDNRAYAPLAKEIAENGYLVVIVPMPLSLAVLDSGAAEDVMVAFPGINFWAIGGHSLGGVMAANFALNHPDQINGLVLLAAYSASSDNLATSSIKVLSISATLDGLSTPEKINSSMQRLPARTTRVVIQGGNHAQFGWYGNQPGDLPATISREKQQSQIIQATLKFLGKLQENNN